MGWFRESSYKILAALLAALLLAGCGGPYQPTPTPTASAVAPTAVKGKTPRPTHTATPPIAGLRMCDFIPGQSQPAAMPPEALSAQAGPSPTARPVQTGPVSADLTAAQLDLFNQIQTLVNQSYADPKFNGRDWPAIGKKYEALIQAGLGEADFQLAMQQMLDELDGYSFLTRFVPDDPGAAGSSGAYVGLGYADDYFAYRGVGLVTAVYPGSPAARAGLQPHDRVLAVNHQPVSAPVAPLTTGPKGTPLTLRVQPPGQPPRDVTLATDQVSAHIPADECLFSGTRIVYLRLPDLVDQRGVQEVGQALAILKPLKQLDGLVIDTRGAGLPGFSDEALGGQLAYFLSKSPGSFYTHDQTTYAITLPKPVDVTGSQSVPLVVLVDETSSISGGFYAMALQQAGRARVVGQTDPSPLFLLQPYDLNSLYTLWLVTGLFQPEGKARFTVDAHLEPDITVPARWDLFSAANDPELARAVDLLMAK